jgi:hypothetical protein
VLEGLGIELTDIGFRNSLKRLGPAVLSGEAEITLPDFIDLMAPYMRTKPVRAAMAGGSWQPCFAGCICFFFLFFLWCFFDELISNSYATLAFSNGKKKKKNGKKICDTQQHTPGCQFCF